MSSGRKKPVAPGGEGPADPGPPDQAQAHLRLRQLYEISKLLTSFESIEGTMTAIVGVIGQTLALRSVIFILEGGERPTTMIWRASTESEAGLRAAKAHARGPYAYLVGSGVDLDGDQAGARSLPGDQAPAEGSSSFVLLPLVIARRPIFGALQFETAAILDEADLVFVNVAVNQLAVALDRQAAIEARQSNAEAMRGAAEAREAQTEVERSWLKTVLDRMPAGVIIGEAPSERLLLANRQAEQIWDRPLPLGTRFADDRKGRGFHPEDGRPYEPEEWPLARSIANGEIVTEEEIEYLRSDGTRSTLLVSSAPIESPDRRIVSGVATFYDITQRKQVEKSQRFLAEASSVLASSLDYRVTVAAVVRLAVPLVADLCFLDEVGEDGEIRRLEVAFADPKQQDVADRVRQLAPRPGSQTPQAKVLESGEPLLLAELAGTDLPDTTESLEIMRAAALRSMMVVPLLARGQRLGALTLARTAAAGPYSATDLTFAVEIGRRAALAIDNARLYQHAQKATRTRDDLLAVVSHDLRTPLATIFGTVQLLAQSGAPEEKRQKWVATLRRSAEWMKRLIEDLLDIARIEAGRFSLAEQPCTGGALLEEAVELHRPLAQQKMLRLEGQVIGRERGIRCDRPRILQVLSNLIGNAIKFTPEGGAITVRAEFGDREARFSVTDSGSGIADDELPHVFERFWQARKAARTGAGLGLAIAKGIVQAHRGKIWAESAPGKGSTFFFTLPLPDPEDGPH
jgi:signal transduction histidine kinase